MNLKQSNPFLKSAADRKQVLRIRAQSSSAVEGIRVPFTMGKGLPSPPASRRSLLTGSGTRFERSVIRANMAFSSTQFRPHCRMYARDVDAFAATGHGTKLQGR